MRVDIVGIGMGDLDTLTIEGRRSILHSQVYIGAKRMLQCVDDLYNAMGADRQLNLVEAIAPSKVVAALEQAAEEGCTRACVLCSGDTGFFSLASTIRNAVENMEPPVEIRVRPGITTVQFLAARLGRPWQNCKLLSAHGRDCNVLGNILTHNDTFLLTGGDETPATIIQMLCEQGLGFAEVTVAEQLSYPDERIVTDTAANLQGQQFESLSAVWVHHDDLADAEVQAYLGFAAIPDELFIRGKAPMTKCEVRGLVTSKIHAQRQETVWDVGAGTGSVSVEVAAASPFAKVFAIEMKEEACQLIEENRKRFGTYNVTMVQGRAPEALADLPAPDVAFIGGSTGNFEEICECVLTANPACRIVATAVTVETVSQAAEVLGRLVEQGRLQGFQSTQLGVTRTREAGRYHLFAPESPVFIFEARGVAPEAQGEEETA